MSFGLSAYGTALYGGPTAEAAQAGDAPSISLEWSPTTGPLDAPVWVQIPQSNIRSGSLRRGRSRELDRFDAGGMTVMLDNRDRAFEPSFAGGANYPNVVPMKRIRLRETYAGVTYERFSGFVNEWTPTYINRGDATVTVTATDLFKVLGGMDLPSSVYAAEVELDQPASWWRLNEASGTTAGDTVFDSAGNCPLQVLSPWTGTFSATGMIVKDQSTACQFTAAANGLRQIGPAPVSTPPMSIEGWFKVTGDGTLASCSETFTVDGSIPRWYLQILIGAVLFTCDDGPDTAVTVSSGVGFDDDSPHHVVGTWAADGGVQLYIDGALIDSDVGADPVTFSNSCVLALGTNGGLGATGTNAPTGTVQDFAVYPTVLTAERVLAHYRAGIAPWGDDTTGDRLNHVLDVVGIPESDRDIDDGNSTLQTASLATTALEHAAKVGDSEFGRFFITGDGKVRLIERHAQWKPPYGEPIATFSDDGSDTGYVEIEYDYSDQLLRNRVTISRNDGTAITVKDDTSIARFGPQSYTRDGLLHDDDLLSLGAAQYIMSTYKDPLLRVSRLTVRPRANPDGMFPEVLKLELGYRVTVEQSPPGGGPAFTQESVVESIEESIGVGRDWTFVFNLSPADTPGALVLDDPVNGILDQNVSGY